MAVVGAIFAVVGNTILSLLEVKKLTVDEANEKFFPSLYSGNAGRNDVFVFAPEQAQRMLALLQGTMPGADTIRALEFDPARHALITYAGYYDETEIYLGVVDKQTGQARALDSFNMVDVVYFVEQKPELLNLFPEVASSNWREEGINDYDMLESLFVGGTKLDIVEAESFGDQIYCAVVA